MDQDFIFPLIIIFGGIISGPAIWYFIHSVEEKGKDRVRNMYAELVKEKLDVIKTALAMGHSSDEIRELDARLEKLIGTEKMLKTLKKGKTDPAQDAQLHDIDLYNKAESELIESAVNGKFDHTEFKLFDYRLNGEIKETCLATYKGVDYGDASTGQQIYVGIDIINVLSVHYDMSVVLFIDHIESLTLPITADTQVIGLCAKHGVKELKIEIEGE